MTRALLALLFALAGVAHADEEVKLPLVTRATLDNGLRMTIAEYHELPLVEIYMIVGAGAAQDPAGKDGLASLTAGSLSHGTEKLSAEELAGAIEGLGGRVEAAAGTDGTIITAEFLAKDFRAGLDLLRQFLLEPAFKRDEIRRARDEQSAGLVASLEDTSAIAEKCFAGFLYGSHPYGRPVDGRRATVAKLGRGDVKDFYDRWYHPNATILTLVGDVGAQEAVVALREAFGAWRPRPEALAPRIPPPSPLTSRKVLLVDKADATQTQIRFGNVSIKRSDPSYIPAQVANTILGGGFTSKLIEELRIKRSLTYAAWSMYAARLTGGDFRVGTFTKSPTTGETLKLALDVEGGFRGHAPDAGALQKAKTYLRGQFPLKVESPDALAARLAEIMFHGLPEDELFTYRSRVAAVGAADVAKVTDTTMPDPSAVAIVVVGKAAEVRPQLEAQFGQVQSMPAEQCETLSARTD